ncbi:hypothetical protein DYU05_01745 [Mucilaginibacter terrenus]|uniref:Uncharacterized protein n=1 Tax=Mucilaginibacter terrenus TaxID=2482727 RepID=A0A3E2NTP2_9SPHI|nr:hypothetical protein [Mucilaginibacter terrenus]RFZ84374.1 hypothetical protein DYU05_01745 [Mucilaginibacter terrenus]
MSIVAHQQTADVQLKVVTVNKGQAEQTSTGTASSKIFTISFSYLKKAYRTKVMKVIYANKEPMYKVVLPCIGETENCMYWLQRENNEWTVALGDTAVDNKVFKAVTSAIECME